MDYTKEITLQKLVIDDLNYDIRWVPGCGPFPSGYYSFEYGEKNQIVNILGPTYTYEDSLATLANFVGYTTDFLMVECRPQN